MSRIINYTLRFLYERHRHRLSMLVQPRSQQGSPEACTTAISTEGAPLANCYEFKGGRGRQICRRTIFQLLCYNGQGRLHALKFQFVVLPNGLIGRSFGSYEDRRHDCGLLYHSGLRVAQLTQLIQLEIVPLSPFRCKFNIRRRVLSTRLCLLSGNMLNRDLERY